MLAKIIRDMEPRQYKNKKRTLFPKLAKEPRSDRPQKRNLPARTNRPSRRLPGRASIGGP